MHSDGYLFPTLFTRWRECTVICYFFALCRCFACFWQRIGVVRCSVAENRYKHSLIGYNECFNILTIVILNIGYLEFVVAYQLLITVWQLYLLDTALLSLDRKSVV